MVAAMQPTHYDHLLPQVQAAIIEGGAENPQPRRRIADERRVWAAQTRATNPRYWLGRQYLPLVVKR